MALNLNIISKFNDKGVKEATAAFGGVGKTLGKLAGIVAAAFSVRAISNFARESIAAAEGVAVANQRLDQIAKSMGIFGEQTSIVTDRLKAYAESNELILATDAEVIKATQAKLLTFKELAQTADVTGGAFDRATAAAVDLAAAGFGTAEGNAIQLGKALNNPIKGITALTRSGITFTDAERQKIKALTESGNILEAQNLILSAIETQVGGTAAATATASQKMKISFDNIREAFGAGLMPAFEGFADAMFPVFQKMSPIIEKLGATISAILVPAFEKFGAFMENSFIPFFDSATNAFSNFVSGVQGGSFDLTTSLTGIFERIAEMRMALLNGITAALPGIIDAFVAFLPKIISFLVDDLLPAMINELSGIVTQLADLLVVALPKLVEALLRAVPMLLDGATKLFETLVNALVIVVPKLITALIDLLPKLVKTINEMLPKILESAIRLFTALVEALPVILPMLIKAILDLLPEIVKTLVDMLPALVQGAVQLFLGIAQGVVKALPEILRAAMGLVPEIVKAIIKLVPELVRAGFELLAGLAKGIVDNVPKLLGEAVNSVGRFLVNGVKDFLGIKSPSTVFYDIGENVTTGLATGISDTSGQVVTAAEGLVSIANDAGSRITKAFDKSITTISSIPGIAGSAFEETVRITVDQVRRMAEETEGVFAQFDKKGNLLRSYTGYGKSMPVADVTGGIVDVGKLTDDLNSVYEYMGAKTQKEIERINRDLFGGTTQQAIDALTGQKTFVDPKTGRQTTIATNDREAMRLATERALAQGLKPLEPISTSIDQLKDVIGSISKQVTERGLTPFPMARGGFVDTATLAVVGEAGPEVVMPLDQFINTLGQAQNQGGATYQININAGIGSDPVSIGRYVTDAIKRYENVSGKVFASA